MVALLWLTVASLGFAFLGLEFDLGRTGEDIVVTLVTGVGLIFVMFLALWAMAMMSVAHKWAHRKLVEVDTRLVPFGQTGTGKWLHGLSKQLESMVDEPNDPLIVRAAALLYKTLPQTEQMITKEQMSEAASTVVAGLSELLDGVKSVPPELGLSDKAVEELRAALMTQTEKVGG